MSNFLDAIALTLLVLFVMEIIEPIMRIHRPEWAVVVKRVRKPVLIAGAVVVCVTSVGAVADLLELLRG